MFSSPEPTPGHYADPFLKERLKMLNDYNRQRVELGKNGIKDHVGHRVYGAETQVRSILTQAITQTDKARSLEVLEAIKTATQRRMADVMPGKQTQIAA